MNNRQPPYSDLNASPFSGASQMQRQQLMAPRMQENTGNDYVHSPPDSFAAAGNLHYISSQWNRDVPKVPNSNQLYPDARVNSVSHHQGQVSDSKTVLEKQANTETGLESHEQGMEIGYEDKPRRLTFEDQEKKFQDEVLKLIEEQNHSEDAENSRHREKIIEIKDKYQENLLALRAQQARRREEFLKKELEGKLDKCHQSEFGNPCVITSSSTSFHGYVGPIATEVHQAYPSGHTREQSPYLTRRSQGTVERVPYPHGRVYNNTGARLQ